MITLEHLQKTYSTAHGILPALDNINLHVKAGEIYGIIGKSGAGKSTLIRCVNLLEKPTSGQVIVDNQSLTTLSASDLRKARHNIGMIFQHFNLLNSRTVYQNIALPLEFLHCSRQQIAETIRPLLEITGLLDKQHAYPAQLSGGQKQRVAIARALACKPKVLLSDEATSALDPETTQNILELLQNIRDTLNVTILLITHEMSVIKSSCDRVGILENGRLIEENEVGYFFSHPQTATAKNFITSSLQQRLPPAIAQFIQPDEQVDTHPIVRLWFFAGTATQPIIGHLATQFGLQVNILQANVECVKQHVMGIMLLAIQGEKSHFQKSLIHLQQLGIQVEVMGYAPNNVISFT